MVSLVFCALLSSTLSGCIPVPRGGDLLDLRFMTGDELRAYSERVFRRQNSVTTRLMMAPPVHGELSANTRRQIEKAESRMYRKCASLNEVASARASGRDVEFELENTVRKTVRACDASTRRLEKLLDEHAIGAGMTGALPPD